MSTRMGAKVEPKWKQNHLPSISNQKCCPWPEQDSSQNIRGSSGSLTQTRHTKWFVKRIEREKGGFDRNRMLSRTKIVLALNHNTQQSEVTPYNYRRGFSTRKRLKHMLGASKSKPSNKGINKDPGRALRPYLQPHFALAPNH